MSDITDIVRMVESFAVNREEQTSVEAKAMIDMGLYYYLQEVSVNRHMERSLYFFYESQKSYYKEVKNCYT